MPKNGVTDLNKMYALIENLCKAKGVNITQMCKEAGVSRGSLTDLKMNRTTELSTKALAKLSNYFDVPLEYFLRTVETKNAPAVESRCVTDEDIKFALFGGSGDITDAMYEEVKSFAAYIKARGEKQAQ